LLVNSTRIGIKLPTVAVCLITPWFIILS